MRVYAENPAEGFLPSPGRITHLHAPSGPGIRDDSGAFEGWTVPTAYDPLISKVVAWAPDRPGAIARMVRALTEYDVRGISTTIGFCRDLVASSSFASAEFDTTYVDRLLEENGGKGARNDATEEIAAIAAAMWEHRRSSIVDRPSSIVDRPASIVDEPAPVVEEIAPVADEPAPVIGGPSSVRDRRSTMDDRRSLWAQRARLESLR